MESEEWRQLLAHTRAELAREGLAALDVEVGLSLRTEEGATDREVMLAYLVGLRRELRQRSRGRVEELLNRMNDHIQTSRLAEPDTRAVRIRDVVVENDPLARVITGREQTSLLEGPDFLRAVEQLDALIAQLRES